MKTSAPGTRTQIKESKMRSQPLPETHISTAHTNIALGARDLVSVQDFTPEEIRATLDLALLMKRHPGDFLGSLVGKQQVLFFEKPSLRTRLSFEAGMASLGGASIFVDQTHSRLDARESLFDIAHNVERWVDVMVLRTFSHGTIEGLAHHADIPVINALSELEHPCQALADFLTLQEQFGDLRKIKFTFVGDGNNVCHSLLLAGAALGASVAIATPKGYEPNRAIIDAAREIARQTRASISILNDPHEAVAGADAVYTDAWASMGQEHEATIREAIFADYQVNDALMAEAKPYALFMHCLPAHRGQEVTNSVIDSSQSVVFEQAENRMHVQKAILYSLLGGGMGRLPVRSAHA